MMKKIFFIVATICVAMLSTGCGVTANYAGFGRGESNNEQIATEIADINAAVAAAKTNNWTVEETTTVETTDVNGSAQTTFNSTKVAKTSAVFTENSFDRVTHKNGNSYKATTKFNGKADVK